MQEKMLIRNQPKGNRLRVISQVTTNAMHAVTNQKMADNKRPWIN